MEAHNGWARLLQTAQLAADQAAAQYYAVAGKPMRIVVVRSSQPECEPKCAEWISAEGGIVLATAEQLRKVVNSLGGRKLPILRHAGWIAIADMYDDGGLSGGTMERSSRIEQEQIVNSLTVAANPTSHPKGTPQTGLCQISNRSAARRNGNWKMATRDRRPKPDPHGLKSQKLPARDRGAPA
jgi:hypothetical protein